MEQDTLAQTDDALAAVAAQRQDARSCAAAKVAFASLYKRHGPGLLAYLRLRVEPPADAEDVLHELWLRIWQLLPQGSFKGGSFRGWLYHMAANYLIDRGRKKKPERLEDPAALVDGRDNPVAILLERERRQVLARCLEKLAPAAAELVKARLGGESYDEVCPRLALSAAQAHMMFHKAKDELQKCVGQEAP